MSDLLAALADLDLGDPARTSNAWERVESLLNDLGARVGQTTHDP